ncbi:unnamed protein product [Rotaria sp. Silwood1]|nr:unnamed protein product [Rotaria sp. Silwood1]
MQLHSDEHRSGYILRLQHFTLDAILSIWQRLLGRRYSIPLPFIYLRGDESSHFHERGTKYERWHDYPAYGADIRHGCLPNYFGHILFGKLKSLPNPTHPQYRGDRIYIKPEEYGLQRFPHYIAHAGHYLRSVSQMLLCRWIDCWTMNLCVRDGVFHEWTDRIWIKEWQHILGTLTQDEWHQMRAQALSNGIQEIYRQTLLFPSHPRVENFRTKLEHHYGSDADLHLPVTVTIGYLRKLTLQVPWKNLYTHPTKLTIDGLYVHVIPKIEIEYNAKQDEKEQHEAKMKEVDKIENIYKDKEVPHNDTFSARVKLQIIQNLELLIRNIHIVYEDKTTKPNHPFAFGITLNYITFQTTNKEWIPTIIKENSPVIYKLGELNALSIYWNTNIKSNSNLPRNEIIKNLQTKIAINNDQAPKDMAYIFQPFNVKTKLIITMKPRQQKFERPMFYITIDVGHISINLNRAQYLDILDLLEFQDHMTAKLKYIKYRPKKFDKTIQKWIFAYNAIVEEKIKPRLACYKWENIKKHVENCREYRYIYVQGLTGKITNEQKQHAEELEKKLDVFNLTYIRQRAQLEVCLP